MRLPARQKAGLVVLSGVLLALGQAPFSWPAIGLAGLILGLWSIAGAGSGWRRCAWIGWGFGFGYFLVCLHWIVEPFLVDPGRHGWMAPFALVLLPGGLALFWALAALFPAGSLRALGFATALALSEIARGYVLTGFPWVLIGGLWLDTPVAQAAAIFGLHGLSAVTLLASGLSVALWVALRERRRLAAVAPLAITVAGLAGWGMLRPAPPPDPAGLPVLRLVQPNAAQHLKWDPAHIPTFYERKLSLTAGDGPADLVIWPETAIPQPLGSADPVLAQISRFARQSPVILGANRWQGQGPANALAVIGPQGEVAAIYDKAHLVPFGEYIPFGALVSRLGLSGLAARGVQGFVAGPGPQLIDLGELGTVLPLICYEAIFPQFGRRLSRQADWMVQITNDAWFGRFAGPQQHLALARFRTIERGLPLVRVANTGISGLIDARGTLRAALPLNESGALDVTLPGRDAVTLHARLGDLPATVVLVVIFLSLGLLHRPDRD